MQTHVHMSPTQALAMAAFIIAILGTIHLLSLQADNRLTRAVVAMGL